MSGFPDDVSIGEVWRGMADVRADLARIGEEVKALPAALAKELDDRAAKRVESLKTEIHLQLAPLERRVTFLERALWGVVCFVLAAVGTAVLALVLHT